MRIYIYTHNYIYTHICVMWLWIMLPSTCHSTAYSITCCCVMLQYSGARQAPNGAAPLTEKELEPQPKGTADRQCRHSIVQLIILYYIIVQYIILCDPLLYSTLLYSTLLYSTLLYSTLLYSTLPLHSTPLHSAPLHSTPLHSSPVQSSLVQSSLVQSSLVQSSLVQSSLVQSSLVQSWPGKISEMAPRNHLLVWIVKPSGRPRTGSCGSGTSPMTPDRRNGIPRPQLEPQIASLEQMRYQQTNTYWRCQFAECF